MLQKGLINCRRVAEENALYHLFLHLIETNVIDTSLEYFPNLRDTAINIKPIPKLFGFLVKLDDIDKKLLDLAQQDSTLPLDAISEAVHLSRNACWRRLRNLEAEGYIKRRVALLDPEKLDLGLSVFIMLRSSDHSPEWQEALRAATKDMPEILGVHRMTGELDYLIRARVAHMADYDRLYQSLIRRVALSDVSASFVMEDIKDTHRLPL